MGSHPKAEVADARSRSVSQTRLALSVGDRAACRRQASRTEGFTLRYPLWGVAWKPPWRSLKVEKTALAPLQKGEIYKAPF
ncbi:hypothetical protein FNW02_20255 [Komarekiella sp. 'clone 1']|uniref:Uncharacterized protein n=1 Tax=Komarekiella delphini-convector SJRDD-AB1 TaxID=2593771 RepID=A0AA40VSK3_9NOST|nr:hypothetical protein [Komarekiella delphini-convector SJRDD-AB1]